MVNQPVLNHEWDFSLGAERERDEGQAGRGGVGREEQPITQFHRTHPPTSVTPIQPTGGARVCWQGGCLGEVMGEGESSFEGKSRNKAGWE